MRKTRNSTKKPSKPNALDSESQNPEASLEDAYLEYMLDQMSLSEEEQAQKIQELSASSKFIQKGNITPNLDSIY